MCKSRGRSNRRLLSCSRIASALPPPTVFIRIVLLDSQTPILSGAADPHLLQLLVGSGAQADLELMLVAVPVRIVILLLLVHRLLPVRRPARARGVSAGTRTVAGRPEAIGCRLRVHRRPEARYAR